ncbi:MAG: hypothetical protein ACLPQS_04660 [Acidimicrobiales bacterium]
MPVDEMDLLSRLFAEEAALDDSERAALVQKINVAAVDSGSSRRLPRVLGIHPRGRTIALGAAAAITVIAALAVGLPLSQRTPGRPSATTQPLRPAFVVQPIRPGDESSPADFAMIEANGSLDMFSPLTDGVVKRVLSSIPRLTNNGLALSPNGSDVYLTLLPMHSPGSLDIERVSVVTGRMTFVADGSRPALSPTGRYLAYVTGRVGRDVVVEDLADHRRRVFDLSKLMGAGATLSDGTSLVWLGDGSTLVAAPSSLPVASTAGSGAESASTTTSAPAPRVCGEQATSSRLCFITLELSAENTTGNPHRYIVSLEGTGDTDLFPDFSLSHTMIMATLSDKQSVLTAFDFADGRVTTSRHRVTPTGLPMAVDPNGRQFLVLTTFAQTGTPQLWLVRLSPTFRETGKGELSHYYSSLQAIAW